MLTAQRNNRNRRPTVLSFRHIQGSLGQRHDIYPQAWESDCGTYEKTTESRARAERREHLGDRRRDRRISTPPRLACARKRPAENFSASKIFFRAWIFTSWGFAKTP